MTQRASSYTLGGVIANGIEKALSEVHTSCPGRVVRYDESKQQVDVKPLVQITYYNEAGDEILESLPVVVNVPVVFPGGGGYRVTFPVKAGDVDGDTVLLVFSESSLDRWLTEGGNDVDPLDKRRFHLSDGIALLGLRDFAHPLASAPVDRMTIGADEGAQIHFTLNIIKIGSNENSELDTVGCGGAILAALQDIQSKLANHTHPVAGVTAGMAAVTSGPSANAGTTIGHVESEYVKVKK